MIRNLSNKLNFIHTHESLYIPCRRSSCCLLPSERQRKRAFSVFSFFLVVPCAFMLREITKRMDGICTRAKWMCLTKWTKIRKSEIRDGETHTYRKSLFLLSFILMGGHTAVTFQEEYFHIFHFFTLFQFRISDFWVSLCCLLEQYIASTREGGQLKDWNGLNFEGNKIDRKSFTLFFLIDFLSISLFLWRLLSFVVELKHFLVSFRFFFLSNWVSDLLLFILKQQQ